MEAAGTSGRAFALSAAAGAWDFVRTPLLRNALLLAARTAVEAGLGMAFWVLAARLYTTEEVGLAAAAVAALGLLATLAPLGLEADLMRTLPRADGPRRAERINAALVIAGALAIVSTVVFVAGTPLWSPPLSYLQRDLLELAPFAAFALAWTLNALLVGAFVGTRSGGGALVQALVFSLVRLVALAPLALAGVARGVLLAWGLGLSASLAVGLLVLLPAVSPGHRFAPRVPRRVAREMLAYSLPNHVANLAWIAPTWLLPLLVVAVLGVEENAYFYVAWMIAWSLSAIPTGVSLSLTAEGSYDEGQLVHSLWQAARGLLLLLLPCVVVLLLAAGRVLAMFGAEYAENGTLALRLMVLAVLPASLNYLYTAVRRVERRLGGVVAMTAIVAAVTLGGSFFLAREWGLAGVAAASLAAQSAGALFSAYQLARIVAAPQRSIAQTRTPPLS